MENFSEEMISVEEYRVIISHGGKSVQHDPALRQLNNFAIVKSEHPY